MGQLVIHRSPPDADHVVTLTLTGELDVINISQFRAAVVLILRTDARNLLVDLDGITWCDNGSLYSILGAQHAARKAGGSLAITTASTPVREALDHNGLRERLSVIDR
ncbi:STAS domain-containing protein [Streptomyces sp. NPDC050732]|uniref:STAS domain-containing protein n=1 Tax=Streptomyces sp. NPDC050732 TaxID=3154632 RepID=UPI00341FAF1B